MEASNRKNLINVNKEDDIVDIVDKIRKSDEGKLTLLIPSGAVVLQDVINLKILQKKAEEFGKEISISRVDEGNIGNMPEESVISDLHDEDISSDITAPAKKKTASTSIRKANSTRTGKRVSDIVRRSGTVDLRRVAAEKKKEEEDNDIISSREIMAEADEIESHKEISPVMAENAEGERNMEEKEEAFAKEFAHTEEKTDRRENNPFWKELHSEPEEKPEGPAATVEEKEDLKDFFEKNDRKRTIGNEENYYDMSGKGKKKKKKGSVLPSLSARFFAIFILFCILTASLSLYFILPKADIVVALKRENVEGEFNFLLEEDSSSDDSDVISVEKTEITSEEVQTFVAKSKKQVSEKATGDIIIYNECSTGSQTLVANTRFMDTDSGKIFQIEEDVVIPGFSKPEDEVIPGETKVSVVAEGVGESYNISTASFTIPKLQELGSWKYSCLYARSQGEMSGGMDKEVTYVAESDYEDAKESLITIAKADIAKMLLEQGDDAIVFNDENSEDVVSAKSSVEVGEIADEFEVTITVTREVYAVDRAGLEGVLVQKIKESADSDNAEAVEESLMYEIGKVSEKNGDYYVDIAVSQDFVFNIDEEALKEDVAGKNEQELGVYFGNMSGVKSVDINLWPFWVKAVPESLDKINITVDINDSI